MFDEKTAKGEVYRNEDKIKRKIRANNCENLYNFRTPHKNEAVWTKKILKFTKIVTVLLLFPWFVALFYLLASNTIHVMENGHLTEDTAVVYVFSCICLVFLLVDKKRNDLRLNKADDFSITVLDCEVWSIKREIDENSYSYYAAICTDTQFCNEYVAIQNYTYNCLVDNPDEQMLLVKVEHTTNDDINDSKPLFYLQTKENLSEQKRQLE